MNPTDHTANLELRDIHLPDGVSWWPPAPGWWGLLVLVLALIALGVYLYRRNKARRLHRAAKQLLAEIETHYQQSGDGQQLVKALSIWLRRVCLSFYPRHDVAGLTGEGWLAFLDQTLSTGKQSLRFSDGAGQQLIHAPYQAQAELDGRALLAVCHQWLKALPTYPRQQRRAT